MNKKESEILKKITVCMDMILIEKQYKYQDSWKTCNLTFLKNRLIQTVNKILLPEDIKDISRQLRELIHAINFAFFIYYRLNE